MKVALALLLIILITPHCHFGQDVEYLSADSIHKTLADKPCSKFSLKVAKKCDKLATKVRRSTDSYLSKFEDAEDQILQAVCIVNERHAETLMQNSLHSLRRMENQLKYESGEPLTNYCAELDSITIATQYLKESVAIHSQVDSEAGNESCHCVGLEELKASQTKLKQELKRAELIHTYIKERTAYLNKLGAEYPGLKSMLPSLEKINHYLGAQTSEYLSLFADRSRAEKSLFRLLNQTPGFSGFANINSQFASLNVPTTTIGAGQTTDSAMSEFKQAAAAKGMELEELLDPSTFFKKELNKADNSHKELHKFLGDTTALRTELAPIYDSLPPKKPDASGKVWQPNPLKTKRFVDRIATGFNLQASPRTTFFPTSGILSAHASYQLSTTTNIGIGLTYIGGFTRLSLSDDRMNIRFGTNGIGLRSFLDWNIKGKLFLQTNYELNHRQELNDRQYSMPLFHEGLNPLTPSLLAGIKLKKPSSKRNQSTVEILYDFMHRKTGQPALVMRMGMEFLPRHGYRK